jgi:hypothetical protein
MQEDDYVVPAKVYKQLLADSRKLQRLEDAGVDNWEGYDFAMEDCEDEEIYGST